MNGDRGPAASSRLTVLGIRARVLRAIRSFFFDRGFVEVETPVRIPIPALELYIDAEASGSQYLRTSPELHMKRLLAEGFDRVYQVGPCFRRGEKGRLHSPEYTMLEWYRAHADYTDMLLDTKALIAHVLQDVLGSSAFRHGETIIEAMPVWEVVTISDAFILHAGWDPVKRFDSHRFDMDLIEKVEPALSRSHPVILKDYPSKAAALARCRPGNPPVAERWELYLGGIELANAFSELTDAAEQRRRFEECARERGMDGREVYGLDEDFLAALARGIPPSGGVALGVDRLVMLMTNSLCIDDVRAFTSG